MQLIWAGGSPYARKVMIVAHELEITEKIETVAGSGTPIAPNETTRASNPLGKLPCLIPDDGPAIYDSRVICQYLLGTVKDQSLLPEGKSRWRTLTLEALADGICDAAILIRYESALRPESLQWQDWKDAQMSKIDTALKSAEESWGDYLAEPFDLGHAALGSALGYLDFRYGDKDWRSAHPGLAEWHKGFNARPSAVATMPAG